MDIAQALKNPSFFFKFFIENTVILLLYNVLFLYSLNLK